jgi:hypothetical protein
MDEKRNDGGSAFPRYGNDPWGKPSTQAAGMTLRDYFAAKALPAILEQEDNGIQAWQPDATGGSSITAAEAWARDAYKIADAMLAERSK